MAKRKESRSPAPVSALSAVPTGRARYVAARFLSDCQPDTEEWLREQWAAGNQLEASRVPVDGLPPVLILATYAREYGVDLVDDYDELMSRFDANVSQFCHPDKFFASCISILAGRGMFPSDESYESINIPGIYEELLG